LLRVQVGPLALDNPIMSASGTFGSGLEGRSFADLTRVGALVSKTVTLQPRPGNPPPRIVETPSGMLNSIGLENRGVDAFVADTLPRMKQLGPKVIVNIGGESIADFVAVAERCCAAGVDALEVNLSCPNVQAGRLFFSTRTDLAEAAIARVKAVANVPVFAKLSPNVTDIGEIARAVEQGGADGVTAINTLIGMAIDWRRPEAVLGRAIGGLSGPAIKPVALRMVYEVRRAVGLPIIGCGGVATAADVLEFMAAGASAVQVGTANFVDPALMPRLAGEVAELLRQVGRTAAQQVGLLDAGAGQRAQCLREAVEAPSP
jgi:dihydroorotate dehydrogenase (NAD+) catalytic subunit